MPAHSRSRTWRLLPRFAAVGLLNTCFGYAVFVAFELMDVWTSGALAGATIAGIAFNFQNSRRFVFRCKRCIVRFVAIYAVGFALNWSALRTIHWCGLLDLESEALLTLPIAAVSFFGQQALVFGQPAGQA